MSGDVVVIGGGLSGLSAAVELAVAGRHVTLVERSPKLGGRCFSFREPITGTIVDNGQHVLLAAYLHTVRYLRRIDSERFLERGRISSPSLFKPGLGVSNLDLRPWSRLMPFPRGIVAYKHLTLVDKLNLFRVGAAIRNGKEIVKDVSVEEWLDHQGQSENAKAALWYPLAVSIMNETPEKASARLFVESLHAAFTRGQGQAEILVPSTGQTELYVDGALELLRKKSCHVRLEAEVASIEIENERVTHVRLSTGETIAGDAFIATVPSYALEKILPNRVLIASDGDAGGAVPQFDFSPIVSVYLWFDRPLMKMPMLGLIDRNVQWLFDRSSLIDEPGSKRYCICAVASAAYELAERTKEEIVEISMREIRDACPVEAGIAPVHTFVLKEKRATISITPDSDKRRPLSRTKVGNLFLGGDWTQTGLPATIEGAIKSGQTAASLTLAQR